MNGNQAIARTAFARPLRRVRAFGVLLAVLSLLIQTFVVQPHIDGLSYAHVESGQVLTAHVVKTAPAGEAPACIICQEAAIAGAVTLAAAPALLLVERNFINAAPIARQRVVCAPPAHNWQSRAPPHFV